LETAFTITPEPYKPPVSKTVRIKPSNGIQNFSTDSHVATPYAFREAKLTGLIAKI